MGEDGVQALCPDLGKSAPSSSPTDTPPHSTSAAAAADVGASSPPLSTRDDEGGDLVDLTSSPPSTPSDGETESPPPPPPQRTRRTSSAAAFLLQDLGLSRAQVAAVGLQLLRRDVRELKAQAARLEGRGISRADAPAAVAACPALLTVRGAPAAAALLAQAGLPRAATGTALSAFPSLLDAPGTGLHGALGGLLADAAASAAPSSSLAALQPPATLPVRVHRQPSALRVPAVDVRLHPVASSLVAAGARPADVAALARAAPGLLSTRAGRSALEWLWTRGVPAADAVTAGLALGCPGLCIATSRLLAELEAAGVRAPDGLRLVLARPRLRRACANDGSHAARRVRAALRALCRAGVPSHAVPALVLAAPEVLERGLGPGPRALAAAGLSPPEVGAALAAVPRLALTGRGRQAPDPRRVLAQLAALGLSPPAVRAVLVAAPALAVTPPSTLRATARALVAAGIPRRALAAVLEAAPTLLASGPDGVRAQVAFLAGVGVHSGAAAARWPALLDPSLRAQVRFLRSRHGLAGARTLGRALASWPHLHGFGEVGGSDAAGAPPSPPSTILLPPVPAGLHDLRSFVAALAGGAGPALDALLANPTPPAVPMTRSNAGLALSPGAAAAARSTTPAAAAHAATAAAAAAAGASPAAVALLSAGVPWRGVVAAACLAPALLSPALAHPLARRLASLRDAAGLDGEGLGRLLRWSAAALADAPPDGLRAAADALAAAGVPNALLGRALLSAPALLLLGGGSGGGGPGTPAAAVAALAALGLDRTSIAAAVSRCPPLLLHSPSDLAERAAVLRGFGLDARSAARAAARCPVLLTLPLGRPRYRDVAAFLEARLGLDAASAIAAHPAVLIYSLRNRVSPRAGFLAARWAAASSVGSGVRPPAVHPATAPLSTWLAMGDAEFCSRVARAPRSEYEAWRAGEGKDGEGHG